VLGAFIEGEWDSGIKGGEVNIKNLRVLLEFAVLMNYTL